MITRQEAMRAGLTRYWGRPYKYGHSGERMLSNRTCCQCQLAAMLRWRDANLAHAKARKAEWQRTTRRLRREAAQALFRQPPSWVDEAKARISIASALKSPRTAPVDNYGDN